MTDESNPKTEVSDNLPKWIFYFGCLLATIGIVAGSLGVLSPMKLFSDFPNFTQWSAISYVTTGWGIRNLAMGAVMLLALWLKTPSAIAIVFSMRFLTELGDLLHTLATGHGSMGTPLGIVAAVWIAIFLTPEALAARWGITRVIAR